MPTNLKHHASGLFAFPLRVAFATAAAMVLLSGPSRSGEVDSERDEEFPIAFVGSVRETGTLKPIPGVQVKAEVGTWRLLVRTNSEGVYKLYPAFGPDIKSDQIAISCAKEGFESVDVQRRRLEDKKVKELIVAECLMAPKRDSDFYHIADFLFRLISEASTSQWRHDMRPFILIAALLLIPVTVQAGAPRGLSTASNNGTTVAQTKTAEASSTDVSRAADPAPASAAVQTDQGKADQPASAQGNKSVQDKPVVRNKPKRDPLETRVIDGLHRHGIYW